MNLLDIKEEGIELEAKLKETQIVMNKLTEIINSKEAFRRDLFKKSFEASIIMNNGRGQQYAQEINTYKMNYCNKFISDLRMIKFTKSIIEITKIDETFQHYNFDEFRSEFINLIDKINDYTANSNGVNDFNGIEEVYNNVKKVVDIYNKNSANIFKISELYDYLVGKNYENQFKIRFMNENKSVSSLKDNIVLIEKIYNYVIKIKGVNNNEKAKFNKINI